MISLSGVGFRLGATALFAGMGACVRLASFDAPLGQIVFFRSFFALLPVVLYMMWRHEIPGGLKTRRAGAHAARSAFGAVSMVLSFTAISFLPLALATSLSFLGPLLVVPAAMHFLRERPTRLVYVTATSGFVGIVVMLWPTFSAPTLDVLAAIGILAALLNVLCSVVTRMQIKQLSSTEPAGTIVFYFSVVSSAVGLATLPFGWAPMTFDNLFPLILSGLLGGAAQIALCEALARAPASSLAPFEYTALIWAVLLDAVIFSLYPTVPSLVGALIVVASAVILIYGERGSASRAG